MERKVYLLLTDTGTLFTRIIKLYTKKPYNHASLSLDPHLLEVYSFGRKSPRNPLIGGFIKEDVQTGLLKQAKCAVYCCSVSERQYQKMSRYIQKIEVERHLYRYNLLGLFAIPLNKIIKRENAFFCSQFVSTVLKECDIVDFAKPLSLVTPHDIPQAPHFQLIYQGNLEEYINETIIQRNDDMVPSLIDRIGLLMRKIRSA